MPKEKRSSNAPDTSSQCALCFKPTPQLRRHIHFLQFPDETALAGHLREQYGEAAVLDGTIGALVTWVRTIEALYGDMVDEAGNRLPLWAAWLEATAPQRRAEQEQVA